MRIIQSSITLSVILGIITSLHIGCQGIKASSKPQNILVFSTSPSLEGELYELKSEYQVIQIDSCQYIVGWAGDYQGGPYMTHKGNCPNNKHKQ